MDPAARLPTAALDSAGRVAQDVPCRTCGYNLRGLSPDDRCPECGTAVARSMRGDLLAAADPAWLRRVCRGQLYIGIGGVVLLVRLPLAFLFGVLGLGAIPYFWMAEELVYDFLCLTFVLIGVVWVTTLDPRLSLTEQPVGLRRITRGAAIGALGVQSLRLAMEFSIVWFPGVDWVHPVGYSVLSWGCPVLLVFTVIAATFYLSRLAERMPDPKLARRIWVTARNAGICFALFSVVRVIDPALWMWGFGPIPTLAAFFYMLVLIGTWWDVRKNFKLYLAEAQRR